MMSKPLGAKSVKVFKRLLQAEQLEPLSKVITREFNEFDRRIREGDVAYAVGELLSKL